MIQSLYLSVWFKSAQLKSDFRSTNHPQIPSKSTIINYLYISVPNFTLKLYKMQGIKKNAFTTLTNIRNSYTG